MHRYSVFGKEFSNRHANKTGILPWMPTATQKCFSSLLRRKSLVDLRGRRWLQLSSSPMVEPRRPGTEESGGIKLLLQRRTSLRRQHTTSPYPRPADAPRPWPVGACTEPAAAPLLLRLPSPLPCDGGGPPSLSWRLGGGRGGGEWRAAAPSPPVEEARRRHRLASLGQRRQRIANAIA